MDFWFEILKNYTNIICLSMINESFLKIWRVWLKNIACHALWLLKIEMGIAGLIFELHPPNFLKMCIFWRCTNDITTIFCYLFWFESWKKPERVHVQVTVVSDLYYFRFRIPPTSNTGRLVLQSDLYSNNYGKYENESLSIFNWSNAPVFLRRKCFTMIIPQGRVMLLFVGFPTVFQIFPICFAFWRRSAESGCFYSETIQKLPNFLFDNIRTK